MRTNRHDECARDALLGAFADTPDDFRRGVNATLQSLVKAREERMMKRKLSYAPALALMITLMLLGIAVGAAVFPNTLELFTNMHGETYGERLSRGDVAAMPASLEEGDVVYTMNDVIFESGKLFGSVRIAPREGANVVLMPCDPWMTLDDVIGDDPSNGIPASEGAKTYRQAMQEGARVLVVRCLPDGYVIDGQMLNVGYGFSQYSQTDGSVINTFELHGWNGGIERANSYTLRMHTYCVELDDDGKEIEAMKRTGEWEIEATVQIRTAPTPVPDVQAIAAEKLRVVTPDGFTGSLPEYAVRQLDFTGLEPSLFTQAEVTGEERYPGGILYTLDHEDHLSLGEGYFGMIGFEGTQEITWEDDRGNLVTETILRDELARELYYLAMEDAAREELAYREARQPEALEGFGFEQAQLEMEALFARLGISNAHMRYACAMSVEEAARLNAEREAEVEEGDLMTDVFYDVTRMTRQDEGYYIEYAGRVNGVAVTDEFLRVQAFVDRTGIREAAVDHAFGVDTPMRNVSCMDAYTALAYAVRAAEESWMPELAQPLRQAHTSELVYTVRDKARLVPAWRFIADETWPFAVLVSAENGRVLNAPWL